MKTVHITYYKKPKKLSLLILDHDGKKPTDMKEIKNVDCVHYAEMDDYPEMVLSSVPAKERGKQK